MRYARTISSVGLDRCAGIARLLLYATCACFASGAVKAAEKGEARELEEVVVTAQKQAERLQDVPVPVTALNAATLAVKQQVRLEDYYSQVPGLGLSTIGNGGVPTIVIRGITTGGLTNPTVGTLIDEVPYGFTVNPDLASSPPDIDPGDLARVEVLRGPQGTLYGASSMGGLLKYVTAIPSTKGFSGSTRAGFSAIDGGGTGYNVRGSVNVPVNDTFAFRFSGFKTVDPGFVDNPITAQGDINERRNYGGRLSTLWQPTDAFSIRLDALYQDSLRHGTAEVNTALLGGFQQDQLPGTGIYQRKTRAISAVVSGAFDGVELTSVTGFSSDKAFTTADYTRILGFFATREFGAPDMAGAIDNDVDKFSQEVRASIPIADRIHWLLGAFYTSENGHTDAIYSGVAHASGLPVGLLIRVIPPMSYREYAGFTNVTFDFGERFDLQVGGRYSTNKQMFSREASGPLQPIFYPGGPFLPATSSEDSSFTYLVTPRWKISDDLMVYARLASGYRPGGPNFNTGPNIPSQYDPDTTLNYELGAKGSALHGLLSFDASVYYIDWQDIQVQLRDPFTSNSFVANASAGKSQGVELTVTLRPLTGLNIATWVAYNQAELTDAFPATASVVGVKGDRLPYSSKESGSISVEQNFPLGASGWIGSVGADLTYVGERVGTFRPAGATRVVLPSYHQAALRVGLQYETWSINGYVNNLTDERGILRSGAESSQPTYVTYIQPRTYGLAVTKDF